MSGTGLVQVAILAPVWPLYTYRVPECWREQAMPGCRVVVPFGGRHTNGIIMDSAAGPPPDIQVKEILQATGPAPVVDEPRRQLAQWIAREYFAPPGECLRLFLPPGSIIETELSCFPTAAGIALVQQPPAKAGFPDKLLALITAAPGLTNRQIKRRIATPHLDRSLQALERNGLIMLQPRITGARIKPRLAGLVELIDPGVVPSRFPVRQQAVLQYLTSHQNPVRQTQLARETGSGPAVLQALARKGLVRLSQEEQQRNPFTGYQPLLLENIVLTARQRETVEEISRSMASDPPGQFLLLGVTGSGKTQVYIELIFRALAAGRPALMMVPEISLTPAVTRRFLSHFGQQLAILHSMLSDGERRDQWYRIQRGEARVVIGTRSSLFAPLEKPGLIVIDEEHDGSYKQDETPRYHAREVARQWAARCGAALVLGSATPSVESYHAATTGGSLRLLELPERIQQRPLPEVKLVDLSVEFARHGRNVIVAAEAVQAIGERMRRHEQVMVLLNRRGFAPVLLCRKCGQAVMCIHCSISLTYHRQTHNLLCHCCDYQRKLPEECESCGSRHLFLLGAGTEKLEEVFRQRFPGRRTARFDRDTTRRKGSMKEILDRFENREIDLLVGTQMIAKGHDFPSVTLVVVLSIDTSLRLPDFRSAERTFQLLTQVAGRSGRGDIPGEVYIQTYFPDHYAVQTAKTQDYRKFYSREITFRQQLFYPPFARLVLIRIKGKQEEATRTLAGQVAQHLRLAIGALEQNASLRVLGPAPALHEKLHDEFQFNLLIRCLPGGRLFDVLDRFRQQLPANRLPLAKITVDVDPASLI